jgi:truncated hemoglobin YjbI
LKHEKAYFAGYTDAEGCIAVYHNTRAWYASVTFQQTQPAVIDRLHEAYGGSMHYSKQVGRRPLKRWHLQAINDVRRFLADITPYLREKRAQAEIVLNAFDPKADHTTNLILHKRLTHLKDKRITDAKIQSRLAIAPHDPNRKCLDCDELAFARNFCGKHYQKAKREGRLQTNTKGEGVPFIYGRALQPLDAAYFTGYFDGDGCLMLRSKGNRWYPRITFGQTQPDAVIDLHVIYGGSLKVIKGKGINPKPALFYQLVQRAAVLAFLHDIQPFSIEKREQIDLCLSTYRSNLSLADGKALQDWLSTLKKKSFAHEHENPGCRARGRARTA